MSGISRVAAPPSKPTLIYDGDCRFCVRWIRRWQRATGERVAYLPFQDLQVAAQFPEIPRDQFETAVQLIEPDGVVTGAAEAVFRSLAFNPRRRWLLERYRRSRMFARVAEWSYGFVARHRSFFSALTRWLPGGRG